MATPQSFIADSGATHVLLPAHLRHTLSPDNPHLPPPPPLTAAFTQPDGTLLYATEAGHTTFGQPSNPLHLPTYVLPGLQHPLAGIAPIVDQGNIVEFHSDKVIVRNNTSLLPIVSGQRVGNLWYLPPTMPQPPPSTPPPGYPTQPSHLPMHIQALLNVYPMPTTQKGRMLFFQKALCSPTKSTLTQAAVKQLNLPWPDLTPASIRKNYVDTIATAQGHLHRQKAGVRSTRPNPTAPIARQTLPTTPTPLKHPTNIVLSTFDMSAALHTDTQGAINKTHCFLIGIIPNKKFIHIVAIPANPSNKDLMVQFELIRDEYAIRFPAEALLPQYHVTDNIIGKQLALYFARKKIHLQVVPPDRELHRRNQSERAGETAKAHLISTVATCSKSFPNKAVHRLAKQAELTLNLLRESDLPGVSAWDRLRGPLDHQRHELYPIGCPVAVYDPYHTTWGYRAIKGYYIGTNLLGFRSHRIYIPETDSERDSVSIQWLPNDDNLPLPYEPIPQHLFTGDPTPVPPPLIAPTRPALPTDQPSEPKSESDCSKSEGGPLALAPPDTFPTFTETPQPPPSPKHSVARNLTQDLSFHALMAAHAAQFDDTQHEPPAHASFIASHAALYTSLYNQMTQGPDHEQWVASHDDEWRRHIHRAKTLELFSTDGSVPQGARVANVAWAARVKRDLNNTIIERRTRVAFGIEKGKHLSDRDVSSTTCTATTFKLMLNAVVSDPHLSIASIDVTDFYIQHDADPAHPAYVRCRNGRIPERTRQWLGTAHLSDDTILTFKCLKVMYGQDDAGKISQDQCNAHLAKHGYVETTTSCLFKSTDPKNNTLMLQWCDDFFVAYDNRSNNLAHLVKIMKLRYPIKVSDNTTQYLGFHINLQRSQSHLHKDKLELDMPNYAMNGIGKLQGPTWKPAKCPGSPSKYIPIHYTQGPQLEELDESPPATAEQQKWIRSFVGIFRYWAEAVAPLIVVVMSKIASRQENPTVNTYDEAQRVLSWIYHHPNSTITFYPSNMQLHCHSDASYLSEPKSRSRAAGYITCGEPQFQSPDQPFHVNGAAAIISRIIPTVVRSAHEAEYAGLFINATELTEMRETMRNLGFPQLPIPIIYDNIIAGKIANNNVKKHKYSKVISMNYHWIKDRIKAGHFTLKWAPGKTNLADFFTKLHPVNHFQAMLKVYCSTSPRPTHTSQSNSESNLPSALSTNSSTSPSSSLPAKPIKHVHFRRKPSIIHSPY